MANYTSNYNLEKPLPEEFYDIDVMNSNMDKIDEGLSQIFGIPAFGASYDMTAIIRSGSHRKMYITDGSTLGTPYKAGVTTKAAALIFSYASSTSYGFQIAICAGDPSLIIRNLAEGNLGTWKRMPYLDANGKIPNSMIPSSNVMTATVE